MKNIAIEMISKVVGPVTKVGNKGNVYSFSRGGMDYYFRLSVMEKDGGVDIKYIKWSLDNTIPLVLFGHGAKVVADRVRPTVDYNKGFMYSVESFITLVKNHFAIR